MSRQARSSKESTELLLIYKKFQQFSNNQAVNEYLTDSERQLLNNLSGQIGDE